MKLANTLAAVAIVQTTGVAPAIDDQLPAKLAGTCCLVSTSAYGFSTYQRMRKRWVATTSSYSAMAFRRERRPPGRQQNASARRKSCQQTRRSAGPLNQADAGTEGNVWPKGRVRGELEAVEVVGEDGGG